MTPGATFARRRGYPCKYPWSGLERRGDFFLIPGQLPWTTMAGIRSMAQDRGFRVSVRQFRASCIVRRVR